MSEANSTPRNVQARVLRQMRVLPAEKPGVAVLEIITADGSEFFAVTPDAMDQLADHLKKNAASIRQTA